MIITEMVLDDGTKCMYCKQVFQDWEQIGIEISCNDDNPAVEFYHEPDCPATDDMPEFVTCPICENNREYDSYLLCPTCTDDLKELDK